MKPALPHPSSGIRFRVWLGFNLLCFVVTTQLLVSTAVARTERHEPRVANPTSVSTGWTKVFSHVHRD